MQRSPRRRRMVLAGVVAGLALLLGSFAFVQSRADATWQAMTARGAALRTAWQAQPHRREPVSGDATNDSAFEHYARAAEQVEMFRRDSYVVLRQLLPHAGELPADITTLRPQWRTVIDELLAGAQATNVRPIACSERPADAYTVNLLDYRWVANIAVFEARALRAEGRDRDSVSHTLAAATLGADLVNEGILINQMIGCALLAIATSEAWPEQALLQLNSEALTALAAGLETIDYRLPEHVAMGRELLFIADNLQQVPDQSAWCGIGTWQYGFSSRWMLADAFLHVAKSFERMAASPDSSWPQRQLEFEQQVAEIQASGNPVAAMMCSNHLVSAEKSLRETIALIRLLRVSVDVHRGSDLEALPDPLGDGALQIDEGGDRIVVRSAGSTDRRVLERVVTRRR